MLPFRRNKFYKHKNQIDIVLLVQNIPFIGDDYVVIKGEWWNLGSTGNPWRMGIPFRPQKVYTSEYPLWREITEEEMRIHRR